MSRMNWKRAKTNGLGSVGVIDEEVSRDRDPAARWLKREEAKIAAARKPRMPKKTKKQWRDVRREQRYQGPPDGRPGLVIYTDGACEPNPGKGGWAFVVYRDGAEIYCDCGGDLDATNNTMEMTGVLRALEWILDNADGSPVRLLSDSQYVVKGCNEWRLGWARKGWRKSDGGVLANESLWREIDAALRFRPQKVEWVKGHAGILGNERADELSNQGRKEAIAAERGMQMIREQLRPPA